MLLINTLKPRLMQASIKDLLLRIRPGGQCTSLPQLKNG